MKLTWIIIAVSAAKAVQMDKFSSGNLDDENELAGLEKPEENSKDEGMKEGEFKSRKRPVHPEIKKVEDKKPEDNVDHQVLGSTKIRVNKDDEKAIGQSQKHPTAAREKPHANAQDVANEASGTGHGLSKAPNSNMKMITDQDFAAANSQQNDQANGSMPQNGSWNQDKSQSRNTDGSAKYGIQVTSKEPTPKVPMLINITFPQQLQTRNNSMIQITVGDDGLSKASPAEQAGFKPIVNFAGRSGHIATNDDEFFDKEYRNGKQNEGKLNDNGLSFIGDSAHESEPVVGYKMDDFAFDTLKQQLKHPNLETGAKLQNTSGIEASNIAAGMAKSQPQHMFQDRKGMNSKNGDNSVTYLKMATKLMNDKDTTDNIDYFIPKQLESGATTAFSKEKNDYGFTDQNSEDKGEDLDSRNNENVSSSAKKLKKGGRKKKFRNKERIEDNKDLQDNGKNHNNENKWNKGEKENKGNKELTEANDDEEEIIDNKHNYNKDKAHSYSFNSRNSQSSSVKSSSGKDDNNQLTESESAARGHEEKVTEVSGDVSTIMGSNGRSKPDASENSSEKEDSGNGRKAVKNTNGDGSSFESEEVAHHKAKSSPMIANENESDSNKSGFTSNGAEVSTGIARNDKHHRKVSNFSAKPTHSVKYSSPKGHWKKEKSDYKSTANVKEMKMKGKQKTLAHKHLSEVDDNDGSSNTFGASEMSEEKNQHHFGSAANVEKPHMNSGRYTNLRTTNSASMAKGATSPPESSSSHSYTDKHQQSEEVKDIDDVSNGDENRKFMKMMDSDVSDHKVEKQKQVHGRVESNKFTNLEQEILSQQADIARKKPEKMEFEQKADNLFDKDIDLSTEISKVHNKVEGANKKISGKEQNGDFSFNNRQPETVSQEYRKPESVSHEDQKPEYMSQGQNKSESVSQEHQKSEYTSQEYKKPEYISQEYKKPEYLSQEYKKPEYVSQNYKKPENLSQEYSKPESVSQEYKFDTENRTTKFTDQSHVSQEGRDGKTDATQYLNNLFKGYVHFNTNGTNIISKAYEMQSQAKENIGSNGKFTDENETASFNQTGAKKETGTFRTLLSEDGKSNTTVEKVIENKTGKLESGSSNFETGNFNFETGNKWKDLWNGEDLSREMEQNNSSLNYDNFTNLLYNFGYKESNLSYSPQNQFMSPAIVKQNENSIDQDEASNTTTINVGTGFIKIKYEKPAVQNRTGENSSLADHLIQGESPSSFAGYSYAQGQGISTGGPGGVRKELEIDGNKEFKLSNFSDEKGINNAGFNETTLFHGDGDLHVNPKEQSFSPVINRKNSHHFVIQIKPTHALDGYKVSGSTVDKFENSASSLTNHNEGPEFEDVSKIKHVSRKKFRNDTTDDNDITEDLMTDNVRDGLKKEENVKTYMKSDSKEDLFDVGDNDHEIKAPKTQGKMAFNYNRQSYYEKSNQKPGKVYDQQDEYNTKNSRKFSSSHLPAGETLPGMHNAEHKFGQEGEATSTDENMISSSGHGQAASEGEKMPWSSSSLKETAQESSQSYSMFDTNKKPSKNTGNWRNNHTTESDTQKSKLKTENVVQQALNQNTTLRSSSKESSSNLQHDIYHINQNSGSRLFAKYDSSDIIASDNQNYNEEGTTSEFEVEKNKSPNKKKKEELRKNFSSNAAKSTGAYDGGFVPAQKYEDKDSIQSQSAQMINEKKLFKSIANIMKKEESNNMISKEDSDAIEEKTSNGHVASSSHNLHNAFEGEKGHQLHGDRSKDKPNNLKSDSYNAKENDITESSKPVCKSDCESPSVGDAEGDESNVIGLNLQTGYDRFSGFHKIHRNEDLAGKRIKTHANSPSFVGDKSSLSDETGNKLIFIPEEGNLRYFP